MMIKSALIIFTISGSILFLNFFYSKVHLPMYVVGFLSHDLVSILGVLTLLSFIVAMIGISRRDRHKSSGPVEPIHTFNISELNDEQFHNDFNKVPGGVEVGVQNIPRPQNHVRETQIIAGGEDLVAEDLAKIGIVSDTDKKR